MDNDSYSSDVHARLCVVEKDTTRHNIDIRQLFGKVTALEVCAACLPDIKKSLTDISVKMDTTHTVLVAKTAVENARKEPGTFMKYQSFLAPIITAAVVGIVVFLLAVYLQMFGGKI
jgi:hypothetical protein